MNKTIQERPALRPHYWAVVMRHPNMARAIINGMPEHFVTYVTDSMLDAAVNAAKCVASHGSKYVARPLPIETVLRAIKSSADNNSETSNLLPETLTQIYLNKLAWDGALTLTTTYGGQHDIH